MGEYAEYGSDQQGWYGMFVACGIWCLADVSNLVDQTHILLKQFLVLALYAQKHTSCQLMEK